MVVVIRDPIFLIEDLEPACVPTGRAGLMPTGIEAARAREVGLWRPDEWQ
jgi:hypothetical protein